ncbi:hypothetical protein BKA70DRAFT_1150668 [Coprinopsis sp. MPI-PUGE-AT-0042]|nr:hypothetical protein BKA70DRAFT_1150668 [Coprinopsis sp. MPI-PUGE-AT-0042]
MELDAYIRSNEETPATLTPICLEEIREVEASIAVVDGKVQTLPATLRPLMGEQSSLNSRKSALKSLFLPIRKLPNEILAVVFRNTIRRPAVMGKEDCRTLISVRCVCKRWDGIITSTPTFWRNLEIKRFDQRFRTAELVNSLETWFARAGAGAPLRLSLGAIDHPSDGESSHRFTRFVTSNSWNWHEIYLNLDVDTLLRIINNITLQGGKPCRSLKRLALNIFPDDDKDIDLGILQSLTHLNLSFAIDTKIEQEPELDPARIELARFTHTSVETLSLTDLIICSHDWLPRLLNPENFPALRHLELADISIESDAARSFVRKPPTILHVETLVIRGNTTSFTLIYLTLPSLKSLQFIAISDPYSITNTIGASGMLVDFIQRSKLQLEAISLEKANLEPQINARIVGSMQTCQTLQVPSLDFINFLKKSACTLLALNTIICANPIFDIVHGREQRGLPDELIDRLYTWPSTHTLTIVSPDPKPDATQSDGEASMGLERLIKEGRVEFVQSVDEVNYDLRIIPPYNVEGPFYMPVND